MNIIAHNFNPNDKKYRACCCHVKTFTIIFGILEIFTICFMLVAVLPDINSKMCDNEKKTDENSQLWPSPGTPIAQRIEEIEKFFNAMKHSGCQLNVLWLAWSVLQIFAVNLTFYGMKNTNWKLFLPHMIFRLLCFIMLATLIIIFFTASFFYMHAEETHPFGVYFIVLGTITTLFSAFWIYIMVCQFRCCQFVKRSAETGFSVSNTRPLGPPTLSLSDARPATTPAIAPPIRQLPPLRHAYHRRAPPVYGIQMDRK